MDGKSIYSMYMQIADKYNLQEADKWANENLTDGELRKLQTEIHKQEKANRRNWHIQDFRYIEFPK